MGGVALTYGKFFQELVGDKEVEARINGEVKCLSGTRSQTEDHLADKDDTWFWTYLHVERLVWGQRMEVVKTRFWGEGTQEYTNIPYQDTIHTAC